ncbi:MAG: tetratricopeptide repeat protein [Ignavibacteriales bacterium]|nr:tetratricopeptide repeat protein [Ignavibacteriales bacterium]
MTILCVQRCVVILAILLFPLLGFAQSTVKDALQFEKERNFEEAKKTYEKIIAGNNNDANAHVLLGKLLLHRFAEIEKATEHVEQAIALDEKNAEYHFFLSEVYTADFQEAGIFRKISLAGKIKNQLLLAVQYEPNNTDYQEGLMQYYVFAPGIMGGSYAKAREIADAIAKDDQYASVLAHAGIFSAEGNNQKAEEYFRKAIAMDPKDWRGYYRFGYHYYGKELYDQAIAEFKKYIEVAPDTADSYHSLGEAFLKAKRYDEAIEMFSKALTKDQWFAASVYRTAQCYEAKNNSEEALRAYQEYLKMESAGRRSETSKKKIEELARK